MATLRERLGRLLGLNAPVALDEYGPRKVEIVYEEKGSSGTEIFSGYFSEEYLQQLRGRRAADLWDQMRRSDPKITMALAAIKNPIIGATWRVDAAGDLPEQKLQAEFIEKIFFKDLSQSWANQVAEILTFLDFGFSLFEVTHKICIGDQKFGSYIGLGKLGWRSPRTIEKWNLDCTGELESVTQWANGDLERYVDIEGEHCIVFSRGKEGDNYEGISALRACYGPWKRKQTFLKLMAVGIEKHAFKIPILTIPAGQENTDSTRVAKQVLEAYLCHQKQYITKPQGFELEMSDADFDPDPILNAIGKEDVAIANAFLENFLELGQSGSGSYALSYDLSDFFLISIEHVAKYICDVVNQSLVCGLINLNFGPQENYPKICVSGIRDKPGKEFAEVIQLLVNAKAIVPDAKLEEDMRARYGLPVKSQEDQRQLPTAQPQAQIPAPPAQYSLDEPAGFKVHAVEVSKKLAQTTADAQRFVQELGLDSTSPMESEFTYRFQQCPPGALVAGSLKSFEAMEGITVYYGKALTP